MSLTHIHASFHRRPVPTLAKAKAGRQMPSTHRLDVAQRRLEEQVHTRPRRFGAVRVEPFSFHALGEEGRIQIPLGLNTAVAHVPSLRERLLFDRPAVVACLAQPGRACGELDHQSAGAFSLAPQVGDKHPRSAHPDRAPILPLEGPVGQFLQIDHVTHPQHAVDHSPVQALAVGRLLTVQFGQLCLCLALASRLVPGPLTLDRASLLVVAIGVVGPTLAVDLALQAADLLLAGQQLVTEPFQKRLPLSHRRDGRGAKVQADIPLANPVLGFLVRLSFAHELDVEPVAPVQLAPHQPHVLDAAGQAMGDDGIVLVDDGFQLQPQPLDAGLTPADAARVRLAFDRVHLVAALEARAAAQAEPILLRRLERAGGQLLDGVDVQVYPKPAVVELLGVGVQVVLAEADGRIRLPEGGGTGFRHLSLLGRGPFARSATRHLLGCPIRLRLAQQAEALEALTQAGVVHLAGGLKASQQATLLTRGHAQWDLCYERVGVNLSQAVTTWTGKSRLQHNSTYVRASRVYHREAGMQNNRTRRRRFLPRMNPWASAPGLL